MTSEPASFFSHSDSLLLTSYVLVQMQFHFSWLVISQLFTNSHTFTTTACTLYTSYTKKTNFLCMSERKKRAWHIGMYVFYEFKLSLWGQEEKMEPFCAIFLTVVFTIWTSFYNNLLVYFPLISPLIHPKFHHIFFRTNTQSHLFLQWNEVWEKLNWYKSYYFRLHSNNLISSFT